MGLLLLLLLLLFLLLLLLLLFLFLYLLYPSSASAITIQFFAHLICSIGRMFPFDRCPSLCYSCACMCVRTPCVKTFCYRQGRQAFICVRQNAYGRKKFTIILQKNENTIIIDSF